MGTATARRTGGLVGLLLVAATVTGPVVTATAAGPVVAATAAGPVVAATTAGPVVAGSATTAGATTAGATTAGAAAGDPAVHDTAGRTALQSAPDADTTVTRIEVRPDGAAVWTVTVRTRLANETDVRAFEEFQRRFAANRSRYLDPFRDRMTGVVDGAADATGREMAARNFSATTRVEQVPRRWGVVAFRFRWDGFAATDGDALVVGDVFVGGLFLGERDSLVVAAPAGYGVASAAPEPAAAEPGTVRWEGRLEFADRRPRVRMEPAGTRTTGTDATGAGLPLALPAGAGVATVLAALALLAARRRSGGGAGVATDEERVVGLLERNGGRMRQADVADELGWSASKTSRVLSSMAEAGTVEKVRLGRENLVALAEGDGDAGE